MELLNIKYNNISINEAIKEGVLFLERQEKANIFFLNIDCLYKAQSDQAYREILNSASLVLPDGVGLKFITKLFGKKMDYNCNGSDFSPAFIAEVAKRGYKIFFLGGKENVAEKAANAVRNKIPEVDIVGTQNGYFNNDEAIVKKINASKADILFVAMGVPLQEKWIAESRAKLDTTLCIGAGGLFDYLSGRIMRAPKLVQKIYLEWMWRISMEPKRLWKRYLNDIKFICSLLIKKIIR